MMYKHRNCGVGIITITDTKKNRFTLYPGDEITIDRKIEGGGVICIEEIKEEIGAIQD